MGNQNSREVRGGGDGHDRRSDRRQRLPGYWTGEGLFGLGRHTRQNYITQQDNGNHAEQDNGNHTKQDNGNHAGWKLDTEHHNDFIANMSKAVEDVSKRVNNKMKEHSDKIKESNKMIIDKFNKSAQNARNKYYEVKEYLKDYQEEIDREIAGIEKLGECKKKIDKHCQEIDEWHSPIEKLPNKDINPRYMLDSHRNILEVASKQLDHHHRELSKAFEQVKEHIDEQKTLLSSTEIIMEDRIELSNSEYEEEFSGGIKPSDLEKLFTPERIKHTFELLWHLNHYTKCDRYSDADREGLYEVKDTLLQKAYEAKKIKLVSYIGENKHIRGRNDMILFQCEDESASLYKNTYHFPIDSAKMFIEDSELKILKEEHFQFHDGLGVYGRRPTEHEIGAYPARKILEDLGVNINQVCPDSLEETYTHQENVEPYYGDTRLNVWGDEDEDNWSSNNDENDSNNNTDHDSSNEEEK